jgi:cysteinyl-tRNA synthetase
MKAGLSANGPFEDLEQRFINAMDDDLNSSGALAVLFELARPLRGLANRLDRGDQPDQQAIELSEQHKRWLMLRELAAVLGLRSETDDSKPSNNVSVNAQVIEQAIADRNAAKQAKNYQEADHIRKTLSDQGIELIDKPGGLTDWRMI